MSLVEEIRQSWGWVGIEPVEVVGENDFGKLIVKDKDERYPEAPFKIDHLAVWCPVGPNPSLMRTCRSGPVSSKVSPLR